MRLRLGVPDVPCAKCGTRVEGLTWGELCPKCMIERRHRASRISTRAALAGTALIAVWLTFRLPATPSARIYGAVAALVTFVLLKQIAYRVALGAMKP